MSSDADSDDNQGSDSDSEDVEDSEDEHETSGGESVAGDGPVVTPFPGAAKVVGKGKDVLTKIEDNDAYAIHRRSNPFYPFSCDTEWGLAEWLTESDLPVAQLDKFFKLQYVRLITCSLLELHC